VPVITSACARATIHHEFLFLKQRKLLVKPSYELVTRASKIVNVPEEDAFHGIGTANFQSTISVCYPMYQSAFLKEEVADGRLRARRAKGNSFKPKFD
jgi:hypothetical protein